MSCLCFCAFFAFVGLFVTGTVVADGNCTSIAASNCWVSVMVYFSRRNLLQNITTEADLAKACSVETNATSCVHDLGCSDSDADFKPWIGIRHFWAYTCGDGKTVLLSNLKCFSSAKFNTTIQLCFEILELQENADQNNTKLQCQAMNNFIACSKDAATTTCDAAFGDYMFTALTKLLQPSMPPACGCSSLKASLIVMVLAFIYAALF